MAVEGLSPLAANSDSGELHCMVPLCSASEEAGSTEIKI
jgi:hypothetical protein